MNIFVTDECPIKSAIALDDLRVNKMITESCQMLAAALILNGCPSNELPINKASKTPYRISHKNHPCTIWARQNRANYIWLVNHMMGLLVEFEIRNGHSHWGDNNLPIVREGAKYLPEGKLTPFPNCSLYKDIDNIFEAYRKTLQDKWDKDIRKPKWTNISKPWFYRGKDGE